MPVHAAATIAPGAYARVAWWEQILSKQVLVPRFYGEEVPTPWGAALTYIGTVGREALLKLVEIDIPRHVFLTFERRDGTLAHV
jgi:hypothetical protein